MALLPKGLYGNFFQPVMRLADKILVSPCLTCLPTRQAAGRENGQPTHIKRIFDDARTPWDRLRATPALAPDQRTILETWRQEINPRTLRRTIYTALQKFFPLPGAVPGQTENVYDTLFFPETLRADVVVTLRPELRLRPEAQPEGPKAQVNEPQDEAYAPA